MVIILDVGVFEEHAACVNLLITSDSVLAELWAVAQLKIKL